MTVVTPGPEDFYRVMPELFWCGFGVLLMLMQSLTKNRTVLTAAAFVGAASGTLSTLMTTNYRGSGFFGLIQSDTFSMFFHLLLGSVALLVILASDSYLSRANLESAEFFALILFATAGMGVLASAQELLTAFIGLEMSSIASYVLAGYRRDTLKSSESALKYFLLGSFATAFFLYGIALVYGSTGTTLLDTMGNANPNSGLLILGLALILIGLGFKVAVAPFQVWTPDVYEGAPTPVTALFAAGPKAAAFALLLRIFATVPAATHYWFWAFWILAVVTMFAGNLGALVQTNVKRLLAYSSIAHAGYILVAFAAVTGMTGGDTSTLLGGVPAYTAILFYLLSYALVKVGAFTIVSQLGGKDENMRRSKTPICPAPPVAAAALKPVPAFAARPSGHRRLLGKLHLRLPSPKLTGGRFDGLNSVIGALLSESHHRRAYLHSAKIPKRHAAVFPSYREHRAGGFRHPKPSTSDCPPPIALFACSWKRP
jgi:NADH-quinone oxidoreductase subunit N